MESGLCSEETPQLLFTLRRHCWGWVVASRRAGPHGRPKVWVRYAQLHRGGGSDDWAKSGGVGGRTAGMEESNLFIGSGGTWVRGFLGDSWDLGVWWGHFSEVSNCCYCLVAQSCPTLCSPMGCSLPGSSVLRISQTKILEWVAISFSRRSSWMRDWTHIFCIGRQILYHWATRNTERALLLELEVMLKRNFPVAQIVKTLPAVWETRVRALGQSMGLQRVGHDWAISLSNVKRWSSLIFLHF